MFVFQLLKKTFKLLLCLFFIILLFLYYTNQAQYTGQIINVSNNYGSIEIYRDQYGIPHIKTNSLIDGFYAQGFVQAQDRLWSMNLIRLYAQGRLSEIFGNKTLESDIFFREIGILYSSKEMEKKLNTTIIKYLQAFADGVNDCVKTMLTLPVEFLITRTKFEPWQILDTLSLYKLLSFLLTFDWFYEPVREKLVLKYGRDLAEQIFANRGSALFENITIMNDEELIQMGLYQSYKEQFSEQEISKQSKSQNNSQEQIERQKLIEQLLSKSMVDLLTDQFQGLKGSNSFVISGNLTQSGYPILVNDPHLENKILSFWYQLELSYGNDGRFMHGASFPGIIGIFIGKTDYMALSLTVNQLDTTDLYKIKIKGNQYLYEGEYHDLQIREEQFIIRGVQNPLIIQVQSTHQGPVINKNLDKFNPYRKYYDLDQQVALAWPGISSNDNSFQGVLQVLQSKSVDEIEQGLFLINSPPLAILYATIDNHIGFISTGRLPIRKIKGGNSGFINDGTKAENDWERFARFDEQPRLRDPKKGYIVAANNKFATDNVKNLISWNGITFARSYRIVQDIENRIKNGNKISIDDAKQMSWDVKDAYAEQILPNMIQIYEKYIQNIIASEINEIQNMKHYEDQINFNKQNIINKWQATNQLIEILKKWNFYQDKNSYSASIFNIWEYFILYNLFKDFELDDQKRMHLTSFYVFDHFYLRQLQKWSRDEDLNASWCQEYPESLEQPNLKQIKCPALLIKSLNQAREYLSDLFNNPNPQSWQWKQLHRYYLPHIPFTQTFLRIFFDRSFQCGGTRRTHFVSTPNIRDKTFNGIHGGNFKMVVGLEMYNSGYYILDSGISGNIFSQHYDDQFNLYKNQQYIEMNTGEFIKIENKLLNRNYKKLVIKNQLNKDQQYTNFQVDNHIEL